MSTANDRLQAKVTKLYMDMRLKRISKLNWMTETEQTLQALRELEQSDISGELFYAQLLLTKGTIEAAEEVLEGCAAWLRLNSQKAPACHAYYLYLTTLIREDKTYDAKVRAKLLELSRKYPDIWQIEWLLYYVDADLAKDPLEQYHFLKKMFIKGCHSPLVYLEARVLLERNPTFLYEFSEFEVQLIVFMLRHAGISERVSSILGEYMLQRTDYRYIYLLILCGCYEVTPSKRLLEGICRMMVLGGCRGTHFDIWYRKGIAENIMAEGLYEAFMKSLPIEQWYLDDHEFDAGRNIPYEVISYFAHAACPDDMRTAYLYAFVHKYRERWQTMYLTYEPLIQAFVADQLYNGNVNAGLAYLYEAVLQPRDITKDCLEGFTDICYSCQIRNLPIQEGTLIVRYEHYTQPIRIPFTEQCVIVPLFGDAYTLFAENYNGIELSANDAEVHRMMDTAVWETYLKSQCPQSLFFHMACVEKAEKAHELAMEEAAAKRILDAKEITLAFKEEVAAELFPYWDMNGAYEKILDEVPNVFTEFGIYSKAKELEFWHKQYLAERIGIYGIQFLMDHYDGTLLEYGSIFIKAKNLGIETAYYAQHLLQVMVEQQQLLPQHLEILEAYCQQQADEALVCGFLELETTQAYMDDKALEAGVVQKQIEYSLQGHPFSTTAKLAFLQKVVQSGVGNADAKMSKIVRRYIQELLKEHIYFSWMQPLKVICPQLESLEAFEVLEYRGMEADKVWIHIWLYEEEKEDAQSMQTQEMEMVCEGVYAKRFILFYGERIRYEIFAMEGNEQRLRKQGILQRGKSFSTQNDNRFVRLNHMLALRQEKKNQELYNELERYYDQTAVAEQIFSLK